MEKILLLAALYVSSGVEEHITRNFCDASECVTYTTVSEEDDFSEYLLWYGIDSYEKFRIEIVEKYATRCRHDDLLIIIDDTFVPEHVSGTYTLLDTKDQEIMNADTLITVESYKSASNFHRVFGHEFGHYIHDQYCLSVDQERFAKSVEGYFQGKDIDIKIIK